MCLPGILLFSFLVQSSVAICSLGVGYFLPDIFSSVLGADWELSAVIGQYLLNYLVLYNSIFPFFHVVFISICNSCNSRFL